jgi:hypothetical protein|tara:strand:- start:1998 stop:2672 length:675 start_codon:yes stop_codon:yes gene_type:complete
MEFKNIRKGMLKEIDNRHRRAFLRANTTEQGLKQELQFHGKSYKGDQETQLKKLKKFLDNRSKKEKEKRLSEIQAIEQADTFTGQLVITVEWKKSTMWGSNPRSYNNYGFVSESIGGCGYDKLSTATADALNNHLPLLKMLCIAKERAIKDCNKTKAKNKDGKDLSTSDINRQYLGYGSGYFYIPKFEGGVGVSCHKSIVEGLNLKWDNVTSTNNTDVFLISVN